MKCLFLLLLSLASVSADNKPTLEEFANSNNLFATSLYKQLAKDNKVNFLTSPYSTRTVLAFAQSGFKGETAKEIRNSLHFPDNNDQLEIRTKESIADIKRNDGYTFFTANKLYVKNGFAVSEKFKKAAAEIYDANVENIEFVPQERAAKTINEWVETQTNNKIKNLIDHTILDDETKTILINAIYFKSNWIKPFSKFVTRPKDFYKTKYHILKVDTMHQYRKWFNYCENSELDASFLELPFEGEDLSMIIALPNQKEGFVTLENNLEKVFAPQNFTQEFFNVALPKFKVEITLDFVQTLKNMGIQKVFVGNQADLSGIAGQKGELVISSVLQKTFIDVQEDGVEASAKTFVPLTEPYRLTEGPPEPRSKDFIVDHPFLFYIKTKRFIIFAGRVSDPSV